MRPKCTLLSFLAPKWPVYKEKHLISIAKCCGGLLYWHCFMAKWYRGLYEDWRPYFIPKLRWLCHEVMRLRLELRWIFQQGNDLKHTLNPIENLWSELKNNPHVQNVGWKILQGGGSKIPVKVFPNLIRPYRKCSVSLFTPEKIKYNNKH